VIAAPKPGIYPGVPFDQYQQWEAVNNSFLSVLLNKSPAHARVYQQQPPETTDALRIGHALHTRALEPMLFGQRYAVRPDCDRRTKEGKAIYEGFLAGMDGKQELSQSEAQSIEAICRSIEGRQIHRFIEQGLAEVCIIWIDPRTNLLCKARLDYWHDGQQVIVDLKSCQDASYDAFASAVFYYQYYQQAAWYCDGIKNLTGQMPSFVFMAVEKKQPYACAAYELADENLIAGRKAYRKALGIYQQCLATNDWPGYPDRVDILTMPQWALNKVGVGQFNLISEDQENENTTGKTYSAGELGTDWDQLERDAGGDCQS
jgi:exodeoxyribonuclease VIII